MTNHTRITQRRALRRGQSLWASSSGAGVPTHEPTRDIFADVAIVGAGISGALVARSLVLRGYRVALLDRREPLSGSTMASTALLQFEIDLPLTVLADKIGMRNARRAYARSVAAVQSLSRMVTRERIRCNFAARDTLYLAGDEHGARALRVEATERERAGLSGTFIDAATLRARFDIDRTGAIVSTGNASADPAQLAAALLRRSIARGARVYTPADVDEVSADRTGVVLGLTNGRYVIAKHAVFCTGYELLKQLPLAGHRVKSTWAIASKPMRDVPAWLRTMLVWEASDPYLYVRMTPDGRLVAGGEDEESETRYRSVPALTQKATRIQRKLQTLIPDLSFTISHRWAGAFGESPSGLPIIDAVQGLPHCYTVTGFGGNGITHSVIAAEVVTNAIVGTPDVDRALFRAPR